MNIGNARALSRRDFFHVATAAGAAAWLTPRWLPGAAARTSGRVPPADGPVQQFRRAATTDRFRVQRVRGNVSVLHGSGCNTTAVAGRDGVLLIDSGIVGSKVAAAVVAAVSRAPVTHVVNTHWHFDHTDANAWLHARGAAIIAHENARRRMSTETRVEDWDFTFPASPAGALPSTLVTARRTLQINGSAVALEPYGPSHTDTDISVHLTGADVLCAGDVWWNGMYPFIDYSTGGSIDGTIRAAGDTLARAGADTLIVPGHGPIGRASDLTRYRNVLVTIREQVAKLKAQGRTADEVVAAKPTAAFDAAFGHGVVAPDAFTRLVYKGV
jgi:glyoxylase-like metal-dependent hydrolase (beta-lactamase superfamily II)